MSLLFFAGGECLTRHGVLVRRTSIEENVVETHTRSGTVGYAADSSSVLRNSDADVPRVEHVGGVPYLLVEEARTNLCLQSEALATSWTNTRTTDGVDGATLPPDGLVPSDTLIEDATASASHIIEQTGITKAASSLDYAFSVYVQANTRSQLWVWVYGTNSANRVEAEFDIGLGTVLTTATAQGTGWTAGTAGIERLGSTDWYRVWLTASSNTETTIRPVMGLMSGGAQSYNGDGASSIYLWGMQLEALPAVTNGGPSSYIPTTTVAVARNADTLYGAIPHKLQEATYYAKFIERGTNGITNGGIFHHGGTAATTGPRVTVTHSGSGFYEAVHGNQVDGNSIATLTAAPSIGDTVELLVVLNANGSVTLSQSINAGTATSDTGATPASGILNPPVAERMYIGSSGTTQHGQNPIAAIKVAAGTKTMAEMRAL